jgi:prepilin-type N-terminal cleavage/methylation domain-containing protein
MSIKKKTRAGFTLLELLLVLTLAPIVFFAVYANFSTGTRLWQRLQTDTPEESLVIFRLKVQRDFENALRTGMIPFEGDKEETAFGAGISAEPALGGERGIGQVRYRYDERARGIVREVRDFHQVYRDDTGRSSVVLKGVRSFELSYLVEDTVSKQYQWGSSYRPNKPGSLPMAVKMIFTGDQGSPSGEVTLFIPAGGTAA